MKKEHAVSFYKKEKVVGKYDIVYSTFSGIIAGFPSAFFSRPFLVITTPMHTEMKQGFSNVIKAIYQSYGWKGFMSGLTPSLLASVPGTPLMYLGTYLTIQTLGDTATVKLLSGYMGMAAGCLAYVPPTIINQAKQTLTVNKQIQSMNHLKIAKELYKRNKIK